MEVYRVRPQAFSRAQIERARVVALQLARGARAPDAAEAGCAPRPPAMPVWVKAPLVARRSSACPAWWLADRQDRRRQPGPPGGDRLRDRRARRRRCAAPARSGRLLAAGDTGGGARRGRRRGPPQPTTRSCARPTCAELDALAEGRRGRRSSPARSARRSCGDDVADAGVGGRHARARGVSTCAAILDEAADRVLRDADAGAGPRSGSARRRSRRAGSRCCTGRRAPPRSRRTTRSAGCEDGERLDLRPADPALALAGSCSRHQATVSASVRSSGISGSQPVAARSRAGSPRTSITSCARTSAGSTSCSSPAPAAAASSSSSSRADAERPEQTL